MAGIRRFTVMLFVGTARFAFRQIAVHEVGRALHEGAGYIRRRVVPMLTSSSVWGYDVKNIPCLPGPTSGEAGDDDGSREERDSASRISQPRSLLPRKGGRPFQIGEALPPTAMGPDLPSAGRQLRFATRLDNTGSTGYRANVVEKTDTGDPTYRNRDVFFTERNDLHNHGDLVGRPEGLFTELCQVNDQCASQWEPEGACAAVYRLPTTVKATTSQASTELLERHSAVSTTAVLLKERTCAIAAFPIGFYTASHEPASSGRCQTRREKLGEDDGGSGAGEGDAEQEALRQREQVARLREAAYWKAVVDVIREETWQETAPRALNFTVMAEALGPWVFAVKLAWDFCFFLLDSNFVAAFVYVLAAVVAIMALSADADQHRMTAEQQPTPSALAGRRESPEASPTPRAPPEASPSPSLSLEAVPICQPVPVVNTKAARKARRKAYLSKRHAEALENGRHLSAVKLLIAPKGKHQKGEKEGGGEEERKEDWEKGIKPRKKGGRWVETD
eukprot:jgi/Undpi1/12232/HiC_scaffold_5.g01908.m1